MQLNDLKLLREHAFVNGEWIEADDKTRFPVTKRADRRSQFSGRS